jgi:hypothetical protein
MAANRPTLSARLFAGELSTMVRFANALENALRERGAKGNDCSCLKIQLHTHLTR